MSESERLRERREAIWLRTWLEEILHVHFHDGMEWETVDGWAADPKSFNIFGEPFKSEMDRQRNEIEQLKADLATAQRLLRNPETVALLASADPSNAVKTYAETPFGPLGITFERDQ